VPTSFGGGRYQVKKFLGEGGKKKVYLAHDTLLDRDVAFAVLKTEKLDDTARARIKREAQAMGRLGDHAHIVTVFDLGEHEGQPYMVLPLMLGGDVEGLIEKAPEHRLSIDQAIAITKSVCLGLECAHSKGIVHRDLKPGNVWLSADGTVKIGDFGLALAVDLSRLTDSGMMVGTCHYMPPEQAMGGEVTAKTDLYSLGAMLYEMVTGRPPFVGDDAYAIIGQQINTPPVSPSWHRPEITPALEAIILQLLEKDPKRRPASAAHVRQALESIKAGTISQAPKQEAPAVAGSPLYRRVFVGREAELRQLQSAFDGAMSGHGSLLMVAGEPGIGKTALCEQLSTYVTLRGGKSLVGHCYEEGPMSLPYLAFVEALRSYVITRDVKELRKELGTGAADVARIVSEIREKLKVKLRPPGNPEEERYRLMQAVTGFLSNAASVQPLLVVLEDLHNADKGTLEMLTHVSRNLSGTRLFLVGTYRDVEVNRSHPLSAALAELRRVSTYGRVVLRGLNADEVRRMLENITGQDVPWGLAEAVHRQTEGNPLFVQEVVRYLAEEGLITREQGRWRTTRDTPLEMSIPEGLRDVIGKRLTRLSVECNRLLSVAAVIGREFRLKVLQRVAGVAEDELITALDEAKRAAVVEERSAVAAAVTYRFAHAFFRQTLYEEIIAPRRIRLHQQVAKSLEELYASRLEEHATELAEHFSHSSDVSDLAKAVSYGEMAAHRAMSVYAYGEAARLLKQALKVQEVLDPEDKAKRCDLLLALGNTLILAGETRRVVDIEAPQALSLAEAIADNTRASRACLLAIRGLIVYGTTWMTSPEAVQWVGRADRYAAPDTVERAWADVMLGCVKVSGGSSSPEWVALLSGALDFARRLGDPDTYWWAAYHWLGFVDAPRHDEERLRLVEEMAEQSRAGASVLILGTALRIMVHTFLQFGQRRRAEDVMSEMRSLGERSGQANVLIMSMINDAIMAIWDGRLEEAAAIRRRILARAGELGILEFAFVWTSWILPARVHLGNAGRVLERNIQALRNLPQNVPTEMQILFSLAHLGRYVEVAEMLERLVVGRPGIGSAEDETQVWVDITSLEAAILAEHRQAADLLLRRLAGGRFVTSGLWLTTCTGRHLGAAAVLLGRPDDARTYYQEALEVASEMRFCPEVALTRLQLAELLLEHYPKERPEAREHIDRAIADFRNMKMQPSLERALRHKEILKA
jgi:tetratricopeptide (TPR) repeat protein